MPQLRCPLQPTAKLLDSVDCLQITALVQEYFEDVKRSDPARELDFRDFLDRKAQRCWLPICMVLLHEPVLLSLQGANLMIVLISCGA